MEPLWSPLVATGGNQRQIDRRLKPQKQAKSVATSCHRLRAASHGKEGADGSNPSEGFAKAPQTGPFRFGRDCASLSVLGSGKRYGKTGAGDFAGSAARELSLHLPRRLIVRGRAYRRH